MVCPCFAAFAASSTLIEIESLRKWKETLGLGSGRVYSPPNDPRLVVILHLAMETEGRPDVFMKLGTPEDVEALKNRRMTIKEGVTFCLRAKFRVQHQMVHGLKYIHVVKRIGLRVDRLETMLGSYSPSETPYENKFPLDEAPGGHPMARGHYDVRSRFIDDDGNVHLDWRWKFEVKKNWD